MWKCLEESPKHSHMVGFPKYLINAGGGGLKSRFWPFLTFLACRLHGCSHSGVVAPVQLDRVQSLDPSHTIGSTRKSMPWSQREIQEHHL